MENDAPAFRAGTTGRILPDGSSGCQNVASFYVFAFTSANLPAPIFEF
jgi:hypothetical protein